MAEAVYEEFSGGRKLANELRGLGIRDLVVLLEGPRERGGFGSQKAAAAALGTTPSTLRRWKTGASSPSKRTGIGGRLNQLARAALRRARMGPRTEARIRAARDWRICGNVVSSKDARQRCIYPGRDAVSLDAVVTAFLTGDDRAVEKAMDDELSRNWVTDAGVAPVTSFRVGPRTGEEGY